MPPSPAVPRCACKEKLTDGARQIVSSLAVNWGDDDERADWAGDKTFCSFACLRDWAAGMADNHDGRTI